jgi:hypothetical protein
VRMAALKNWGEPHGVFSAASVDGPRLIPVLVPQPLPMPLARWCEEMEALCRAMEQLALLRERPVAAQRKGPPTSTSLEGCS